MRNSLPYLFFYPMGHRRVIVIRPYDGALNRALFTFDDDLLVEAARDLEIIEQYARIEFL